MLLITVLFLIGISRYAGLPFTVVGSKSMEPTLNMGDLVLLKGADPSTLQKGDIIAYRVSKDAQQKFAYPAQIIHRIVAVNEGPGGRSFRTQGDRSSGQDPYNVLPADILGQPRAVIRNAGWPLLFLQSRQGLIFLGTLVAVLLLMELGQTLERRRLTPNTLARKWLAETIEQSPVGDRLEKVESAIATLSEAVALYGTHLQTHTSVLMHLDEATARLASVVEMLERQVRTPDVPESPQEVDKPAESAE